MSDKVYVNAVREDGRGYNVYTSVGVFERVNRRVVEIMCGRDLEYLLSVPTDGREFFFPLSASDLADLKKYQDN